LGIRGKAKAKEGIIKKNGTLEEKEVEINVICKIKSKYDKSILNRKTTCINVDCAGVLYTYCRDIGLYSVKMDRTFEVLEEIRRPAK